MSEAATKKPRNKTLIRVLIVLVVLAAILVIAQVRKNSRVVEEPEPPVRPVKTITLSGAAGGETLVFPGRVRAGQSVELSFNVAGQIIDLPITAGARLSRGDVVARLDNRDAQSNYDAAKADFEKAKSDLDRYRTLFDEEMIAASELETRERDFDVFAAALERAAKALDDTEIRAPFDGVVGNRTVENFEQVQAKQLVATFQDPTSLDIVIDLPETVIGKGQYFRTESFARFDQAPATAFPLTVKEFSTVADAYTKTYAATLTMPRPQGLLILPDMSAAVEIILTPREPEEGTAIAAGDPTFFVPSTAIVYEAESESAVVWVVDTGSMTVQPRPVEIVTLLGVESEIKGNLSPGDVVVTAGGSYLAADQQVRFFEG